MPLIKLGSSEVVGSVTTVPPLATEASVAPQVGATMKTEPYKGRKASTDDDKMSKADWAAKDRRIGRAGLYQAALQSNGLMQYAPTLADYFKIVQQAAEKGLAFVNETE